MEHINNENLINISKPVYGIGVEQERVVCKDNRFIFSTSLLEDAIKVFEPRMGRPLDHQEADNMLSTLVGYYGALLKGGEK